ncbi:metal ABC transporter substrate-binding protein [Enterococcus sp. DIV0876]|uniref:metal ABC transporter substrate-binding protein n=1 Tax=Enterococcus sp. DIV0876 TaxID=2774633 RepID=UPI003D2FEA67
MKKTIAAAALLLSSLLLGACNHNQETDTASVDDPALSIMTTFYPMYEFTKEVVGDAAEVSLLIPAGTEPHDFEPSAKDMAKMMEADAFVYNSPELETWVSSLTDSIDTKQTTIIEAAQAIDLVESEEGHAHEADHDHDEEADHVHELDPHVWTDPVLAIQEVETIRDQLSAAYPEQKDQFAENAAAYIKKLSALDDAYRAAFKDASQRTFVTQHAAFGYLARQYDLVEASISGISPDQEPTPSRLAELKEYVETNQVRVIYFEENASSKVAETLASETGVELAVLNPLESLTQEQIDNGETYISVMEDNLSALQKSIK